MNVSSPRGIGLDIPAASARILAHFRGSGKRTATGGAMVLKYLIHHHKAGRPHYDLRLVGDAGVRSWSMLKEPPARPGERRLAIEREVISAEDAARKVIREEAFGAGRAFTWDEGEAEVLLLSPEKLILNFSGNRVSGKYELVRMKWYPGNRWLLKKSGAFRRNLA